MKLQIYTWPEFPPIPTSAFNYGAGIVDDPEGETGWGETEEEAVTKLLDLIGEPVEYEWVEK